MQQLNAYRKAQIPLWLALMLGHMALFAVYAGTMGVLVLEAIAMINPDGKIASAAVVAGFGSLLAVVVSPLAGAASDRTRSRIGRRHPWLLAGAFLALVASLILANATTLIAVLGAYCLLSTAMNVYQAALAAIVPDRVPVNQRGRYSAAIGIATALGAVVGTQVAAAGGGDSWAYVVLGLLTLGAATVITTMTREPKPVGTLPQVKRHERLNAFTSGFFQALSSADYTLVLLNRFLMILSLNMATVYLIFVLQDFVPLPPDVSPAEGVAALTLVTATFGVLAAITCGGLADRLRSYRFFVLSAGVLGGFALLLPVLANSWSMMLVFAATEGIALGAYLAVNTALATLVLPRANDAGRDLGILNIADAAPPVAAPMVASILVLIGGYPAVFTVASATALAASLAILPIKSVK